MKASVQFTNHFLDLLLGGWAGRISTVVIGSVRVGIDVWQFATVHHMRHFSPDTSQSK